MTTWNDAESALRPELDGAGFEILGAVTVGAYNCTLEPELDDHRLPAVHRDDDVALVIGNTRRLWPLFLHAYANTPIRDEAHPLDAYSRWNIGAAVRLVGERLGVPHAVRYSFDPKPQTVAIQRLAAMAGVAEASPVGLCVHPHYGPWFSLRAAVVLGLAGPSARAAPSTCSSCRERPCIAARDRMLELNGSDFSRVRFLVNWQAWLAMRDACPVGTGMRYSDRQIRYHYLKERKILDEAP